MEVHYEIVNALNSFITTDQQTHTNDDKSFNLTLSQIQTRREANADHLVKVLQERYISLITLAFRFSTLN